MRATTRLRSIPQGDGDAGEGRKSAVGEVIEPGRQRCGVAVVEHGGELTDQFVGAVKFRAVVR